MASNDKKGTYKTLTYIQKAEIIREVEKGGKKADIAKKFNIPPNTLSTYLKNKDKILNEVQNVSVNRKRSRTANEVEIDSCVLKWFKQARDKKVPISGTLLREKADDFASQLDKKHFKASTGWLNKFKDRHNIVFKKVCGESGSINLEKADEWKNQLIKMIENTEAKNIFNVDETALFYKRMPDKTMALKNEICTNGKLSKERVTILIGANMDGSEKLPLLMIGKSANPRCFKNVKTKPVNYEANKKAWMTSSIFENWLLKLDAKFKKEERKVLLFIDNCTAHNCVPKMNNVQAIFFPANMTSVLQPMDQGIIKNFKHFYRLNVVKNILINFTSIDLLQAMRMCAAAWNKVSSLTISNCFRKAGFYFSDDPESTIFEEIVFSSDDYENINHDVPYENFLNIDENIAVCGEFTDADILSEIRDKNVNLDGEKEDEEETNEKKNPIISHIKAMEYVQELHRYLEAQNNDNDDIFKETSSSLNKIEEFVINKQLSALRQTKILDFFH